MAELNPLKMKDWEIAEEAEKNIAPVSQIASKLGVASDALIPYGENMAKVDAVKVKPLHDISSARYINVTAITPTPLGEGKTTAAIGLLDGLCALGKKAAGTIRQPSGGPTFNIKGSAAGGGLAQVVPLAPFSLGLTGDIDAVNNANNLAMVAVSSRLQHETNHDDAWLAAKKLKRLDIDPSRITMRWSMDFCAQSLRNIITGRGGRLDGVESESGFYITVASEVMAVLAIASDLADLRKRIGAITVAFSKSGKRITADDLEVGGAMTAWLVRAANPTLLQTIEGNPVFVHAGPFANIALGQSSVIADRIALGLADYVVTESGFASEIGFEKFWNVKCRAAGFKPSCSVIVATVRALKLHGGGPAVKPGEALDDVYKSENLELLEKGCDNLLAHIANVRRAGINPVVCLNSFYTDTQAEHELVKKIVCAAGARFAVSEHWLKGGKGAIDLAKEVLAACDDESHFAPLYSMDEPVAERIEKIVKEVYGGDGVDYSPEAKAKLDAVAGDPAYSQFPVCMAKTQYSLSHDPALKGRPKGWRLPVRDILVYTGAGLIVPVAGDIKLMPGTCADPAFRRIDVDTATGRVTGLM